MLKRMIRNWLGITTESVLDVTPVDIATVTVGPDDIVVLMTDAVLSHDEGERLVEQWESFIASGRKCAIFSSGIKLRVIKREV